MSPRRVVVDGSNLATEGRALPSLKQLDEAVRAYREEFPDDDITVVVDASFEHRIDESERADFVGAEAHGEVVSPPAGAIGRGDAFLLRIADKTGAVVLSNDSFQEFHGEFDWLFSKGRIVGGKPVPGVGWIFTPRTPVRGPKSREAVKDAKRSKARVGSKEASKPMPVPSEPPPRAKKAAKASKAAKVQPAKSKADGKPKKAARVLQTAIAEATIEAVAPETSGRRRRRRRSKGAVDLPTVNEPLTFITFIADHKLGDDVEATVDSFSSHGAFVMAGGARCYVPLSAMGEPPPRSAREVLSRGETRTFVLQALDAPRRGIELALPEFARPAGKPTEETVEAEIAETAARKPADRLPTPKKAATKKKQKAAVTRKAATKKPATKKPVAKKVTPKTAAPKKAATKKAATKKAAAKKATTKSAATKKVSAPAKKTLAKKTAAKKTTKKAAATKQTTKKSAANKSAARTGGRGR